MLKSVFQFLLFAIVLCCFNQSFSQQDTCNYTVSGKVLDKDEKLPLPFANVKVQGLEKYTLTNIKGEFSIEGLCDSNMTLVISCLGYCNTTCASHHQHGKSPHIYLTEEINDLDGITIEAERSKEEGTETIAQISIKEDELKIDPTQSLAALIDDQQGIAIVSTGSNVQLPVIHGLYGNRVLILNNGVKHGFQNWGADHAPEIDITNAHRLTIVKGAAGVKYGTEALGGVISIENAPLYLNEKLEGGITTGYQTNGRGYFANGELIHGLKNWSYYLGGNYTKIGDRHTPDYSLTNSGKEEHSFKTGVRYRLKHLDVKVYYSYLQQNLGLLRASIAHSGSSFIRLINADEATIIEPFSYEINQPNHFINHHLAKGEVEWSYSDHAKLVFRYAKQFNQRKEYDVRRKAYIPIIDLDLFTDDYQFEWKHPHLFNLDGLIGLHYLKQLNENKPGTNTTPFIPNYQTERYSGFIVESLNQKRNTYEVGIRADFETNYTAGRQTNQQSFNDQFSFSNLTGSVGYVRELKNNSSFRTNFGTAWRTPNMSELYSFGQHGFKTIFGLLRYYYNKNGDPRTNRVLNLNESDIQAEKGFKWINEYQLKKEENKHTLTAYSHYIQNYIYQRPLGVFGTIRGPMPAFVYEQVDAAFVGFDYSWDRKWTKRIDGTFGLSYLWSQNIEDQQALINQPPITASYKLSAKQKKLWKFSSAKVSLNTKYTVQQFQAPRTVSPEELIEGTVEITPESEIFDFIHAPKGYLLMNVTWSFSWANFDGSISVNNLFNQRYRDYLNEFRYFADEPGRNFLFTLKYNFKNG